MKPGTRTEPSSEQPDRESTGSEEEEEKEDDEEEARRRRRLLEAISGLSGRKRPLAERSEAAVHVSEFSVSGEGEADRVQLADLIGTGPDGAAVPARTRRQLQSLQGGKKTVHSPLSARQAERIQRGVAFDKAADHVSRWSSIIIQNQRSEQLSFPLDQDPAGPRPVERLVAGWRARTPLEQEVFALLNANKQPVHDPVLTPAEETAVRAMSLEEARVRRAELQKNRALQSYYESRARRQRRIKSKQYHRVQNQGRRRQALKKFEEQVQADPGAALEELRVLERTRIQERMSLKHQSSGKWARSRAIVAKYDLEARRAMQDQLEVHRDLTRKVVGVEEAEPAEEEAGLAEEVEYLPDFVNDVEASGPDSSNPWMRGRLTVDQQGVPEQGEEPRCVEGGDKSGGVEEEESEEEPEEALLKEFNSRRKLRQAGEDEGGAKNQWGVASHQEEEPSAHLQESLFRISNLEDVELLPLEPSAIGTAMELTQTTAPQAQTTTPQAPASTKKRRRGIELKHALTKDAAAVDVPLAPTVTDDHGGSEGGGDQRMLIREAFAGDDVVSDFLQDKRKQEAASAPQTVDRTLPGWGEWGGGGLQPSRQKRRRFRVSPAPAPPRKDRRLPDVIISEKRSGAVAHRVSSLPFPFESPAQFESVIRAPLGRTWNTERSVKMATKPKVLTRLGAIIEPMAEEQLAKDARKH